MTCVGIYANNTLNTNKSPTFTITGGTININAPGSGISSSGTLTITGGTITIYSANDALHADSVLTLGKSSGSESDYTINIQNSYEGIEALTINMYSGTINIYSTDDGINAQTADSYDTIDETDDQGGQSGPGGQGGAPGGNRLLLNKNNKRRLDDTPSINLYGGKLYLNADGDGLDSNGNLYIYGGTIEVWGAASGNDDEPFDHDGDLKIYGGTIFAGGTKGTEYLHDGIDAIEQNYIYSNGTSISSGSSISVSNSASSVYTTTAPKNADYLFYSDSNTNSSFTFYVGSSSISTTYGTAISDDSSTDSDSESDSDSEGGFIKVYLLTLIFIFGIF